MITTFLKPSLLFSILLILTTLLSSTSAAPTSHQIDQLFTSDLNRNLASLFPDIGNFTRDLSEVSGCYIDQIGQGQGHHQQQQLNIFNGTLQFKTIVERYYAKYSTKTPTPESLQHLLTSTRDILTRCLQTPKPSGLYFGYTELSDGPLRLEGRRFQKRHRLRSGRQLTDPECHVFHSTPLPTHFDWRTQQVVTPPRDQENCGSCWIMSALGALEASLLIYNKTTETVETLDLAEQDLVLCKDGCNGGEVDDAYKYILKYGIALEHQLPYAPQERHQTACPRALKRIHPLRGYCWIFENAETTMQRALVQYGPLYVGMNSDAIWSSSFLGGIVDDPDCSPMELNHAVLLVGYTPEAWIFKNSWGSSWGENGYFRIARGGNICGINEEMAWPLLK